MLTISSRQRGVSLVESMIALVIISVGLLGIAGLQITSMRLNNSAMHHSQAVWIGYNIADRIRANFGQFANYVGIDTNNDYAQDCRTGACTDAQIIVADAADWKVEIENLPAGRGTIDSPAASSLRIRVMWDDEGSGATGIGCDPTNSNDLTCFTVTLVQ